MSEARKTFLNPAIPLPFCPGCGHAAIVQELDEALLGTGWPLDRIVIVTDIGCAGLSDRNFLTHGFHGLHGRSITYATGIKLANPDLHVVVILGDGGCGIGGNHLVNAARRNIGLSVLVFNNFNFGMTGGQHSVTTPEGGTTATTPWGNRERSLDLCGVVRAAGGTFVARTSVFRSDLGPLISRALAHEGFAFLEVWDVCMSYYSPGVDTLKDLVEKSGMTLGVLEDRTAPELATSLRGLRDRARPAVPKEIATGPWADLKRQAGVIVAGAAGQRIRSGAGLFGTAAIASGLFATQKDDYPITVRTGHSLSEILVSPEPIVYTGIESPDVLLLLSPEGLGQVKARLAGMKPGALVLAEKGLVRQVPEGVQLRSFPFAEASAEVGEASLSVLALGALLAVRPLIPFEIYARTVSSHPSARIAQANRKAAEKGREMATR